jgi:hypothetical protein
MLDELSSCRLVHTSHPWLLAAAALSGLGTLIGANGTRSALGVIAAVLVGAYFAARKHVLAITSLGHSIRLSLTGMSTDEVIRFIETAEHAKNERYLLQVPLGTSNTAYSPAGAARELVRRPNECCT